MTSRVPVLPQCKHIVLVEDDHFELEIATLDLTTAFVQTKLTVVRTVGDFLLNADQLRDADIVVMEHYLPLGALKESEQATSTWFNSLKDQFPEITAEWHHREGGERLVRWMRRNGFLMRVLFYTHSDIEHIAGDVRSDPRVFYLRKDMSSSELGRAVEAALLYHN